MINLILTAAAGTIAAAMSGPVGLTIAGVAALAVLGVGIYHTIEKIKENKKTINNQKEVINNLEEDKAWLEYLQEMKAENPELYNWVGQNIEGLQEAHQNRVDQERTELEKRAEEGRNRQEELPQVGQMGEGGIILPIEPGEPGTNNTNPGVTPEIPDGTDNNIIQNQGDIINWLEEQQNKNWEREDAIRKETQEREDNAYQRAVADMKAAGINVAALSNITPAASGGGITQASRMDMSALTSQMQVDSEELQQLLDQYFKGDQNAKDRVTELIGKLITFAGLALFKK